MGTTVKLIDQQTGEEVKQGEVGRIFVGNPFIFSGYTGGEDKDRIGDLVASGDVGRFDEEDRLFIEGRDDEMIVSGGENVFPAEVEDLLSKLDGVREGAGVGGGGWPPTSSRTARETCRRSPCRTTSRRTSPGTRCRGTSTSSTSCRATPPARWSRRTSAATTTA